MRNRDKIAQARLEKRSRATLTHIECLRAQKCQETEGFKGTEHEGVDVCEDGCVWYNPKKLHHKERVRIKNRALRIWYLLVAILFITILSPFTGVWYIFTGVDLCAHFMKVSDKYQ